MTCVGEGIEKRIRQDPSRSEDSVVGDVLLRALMGDLYVFTAAGRDVARPDVWRQQRCWAGSGKEGSKVRPLYFSPFTDGVPLGNS